MNQTIEATKSELPVGLPKFEKVLLCTDFSPASKAAADAAMQLCRGRETHLTVMHVSEYGPMPAITDEALDYVLGLVEEERRKLKSVTDEFVKSGIHAESVMDEGSAAGIIVEHIGRCHIDLAILGTSGANGLDRLLFGSTAESIFRRAACPILTVGPKLGSVAMNTVGRPVIFATDFNDSSLDALRHAASLAEIIGSPLHVVHVLPATANQGTDLVPAIVGDALRLVATRIPPDGSVPQCQILRGSDVSHAVVEYANAQNAAFIVLGIRRKSAIAAHLPPHRTFRIILTAPCPVLTVAYEI
ncbi:MAG TPA: universal stress protein [Acidobacteriaceae bacterium]|nr:universal stress protein [Acidobacteriaceae bacterium]